MSGTIRFAPSPTGFLHEGHLLSALYVWAAAKKWSLKIHLRIEDHDQGRARKEYIDSIYEDLAWLGFNYDSHSIQSSHFELFKKVLGKLAAKGLVYPCYCSRKQLSLENPRSETGEIIYQGKCLHVAHDSCSKDLPHSLRIHIPDKVIHWHDERLGDFDESPQSQCGDFPIRDRDGFWTYQFAVCVDDLAQGITHIVRGEDILSSTARQILLSEIISDSCAKDSSLDLPTYSRPLYLHHPLIVDSTGKKLSKREHAHSIRQDKDAGIRPEQLLGRVLYKAQLQPEDTPVLLEHAIALVAAKI